MYHILYAADANYFMHLYISLYSLLKNNKDKNFIVYILSENKCEDFVNKMPFLISLGNLVDYIIIRVDPAIVKEFPLNRRLSYISRATYYRIFIGQLLPENIRKILYLDCDTIINDSLDELFDTNLNDYVLGAAPDHDWQKNSSRLNLPDGVKYFNAGVLYINMDNWRTRDVEGKLVEYIYSNANKLFLNDQDVLNGVLYNQYIEINLKYNFQDYNIKIEQKNLPDNQPSVIHYIQVPKPWNYLSENFYKDKYWNYLQETPYHGYCEEDRNFMNTIIKLSRPIIDKLKKIHKNIIILTKDKPILSSILKLLKCKR